ncbi:MAG: EI24 domain-containing protein [Desulfobacterales bacterium]|nr:EI24 domain-containing protein [Desulfobacterales bacterium]
MIITEFIKGILIYFKANRVIFKHKLWPYLLIPGIMSFCYVLFLVILGSIYFTDVSGYITGHWLPGFLKGDAMVIIITVLLWILMILIGYITYQQVVLILLSPLLGYISERVECLVYNTPPPNFNFQNLFKDIARSLVINVKNLGLMLAFTFSAWTLSIIPAIGIIVSTSLILFIQSYYGGFGLVDFTLERKRFSVKESFKFMRGNRGMVTGVGMGFILLLMVPLAGWMAAPGYGTVAATLAALDKINVDMPGV